MIFLIVIESLFLLVLLYARFIEPNLLVVRKIRIDTQGAIPPGNPLRVTLLSDFHYPRNASLRMVRRAIEKSSQFNPDFVFMLGDFFDKNRRDPAVLPKNVHALFGAISSKRGVFGVLGNHDHWFDERAIRTALATETEIRLIDNASLRVALPGANLYLTGVGDLWCKNVDYDRAVAEVPHDASIILLAHNPDVIEQIDDPRILVQFSGHTHGGQIRLPFVGALRVPSKSGNKYSQGLISGGNHLLYVNRGISSSKGIRFLCPPEVTWVELY